MADKSIEQEAIYKDLGLPGSQIKLEIPESVPNMVGQLSLQLLKNKDETNYNSEGYTKDWEGQPTNLN